MELNEKEVKVRRKLLPPLKPMSRSGKIRKKILVPDPIYQNRLIARLTNRLMRDGKKTVAQRLVYRMIKEIGKKGDDPIKVFESAINNVGPRVEVRSRRVGGASYQVPVEVRGDRRQALAIRWILEAAKKRPSSQYRTFDQKLSAEILDAVQNQGEAVKRRDNTLRMAEANKAFAHFRW